MLRKGPRPQENLPYDPQRPPAIPGVTGLTLLGGGGSATVYQGTEPAMRRKVAVKVVHALMRDAGERQVFGRECELAGQLGEHPYAADVYRGGFADDRPYLVMRYYARGSLAATLGPGRQLPVGEAVTFCAQVGTALQFAHDRGILHRDVKPENILCDAFGRPVLADFGIATERDAVTMTLRHAMTPAYAPPEVLRDGGGWPYSDVWSLAATLYALLAGQLPFYDQRQGDPRANMRALTGPLPPIRRPGVSGHLLETLARALIGEPDGRTGSARRLADELNAELDRLRLPPVMVRVDAREEAWLPGSALAPGPGPGVPAGSRPAAGATLPPREDYLVSRHATTGPPADPAVTGFLSTSQAFRIQDPAPPARRRPSRPALAAAGAMVLIVVAGLAYLMAGSSHRTGSAGAPASAAQRTAVTPATGAGRTATATAGTARAGTGTAPPPPSDVTALLVSSSSVRITWKNTEPASKYPEVVISSGRDRGLPVRPSANHSPQLLTGLVPGTPYCFAVGYVYGITGDKAGTSYSAVTSRACVNGGVPGPGQPVSG
jgi:serine/threonine protein kinase